MFGRTRLILAAMLLLLSFPVEASPVEPFVQARPDHPWLAACEDWDAWNKPGPPYQIFGNTYYVGTCGISAILITGDEGHVLIDTGTAEGAEIVYRNIELLGFKPQDVRILLHSHEHFDHVGGMAKMKAWTGAEVVASAKSKPVLETGNVAPDDPQFGIHPEMDPVKVDRVIHNGGTVKSGDILLSAIATPGHTPGAQSWEWDSCSGVVCLRMIYVDSLSPVSAEGYNFSDHPEYLRSYRESLDKIRNRDCDVLLTPHPSASKMIDRLRRNSGLPRDRNCNRYIERIEKRLDRRLARETEERAASQ